MKQFGPDGSVNGGAKGSELLHLRGITKRFGATRALQSVDLTFKAGEIHSLVGQNGAGKSTLIKILSGYLVPDAGQVAMRGREIRLPITAHVARQHGLSFLHQNLSLVPELSVLENIRVGRYQAAFGGRLSWRRERTEVVSWLQFMGLDHIDPDRPVHQLPQAERALIALIRALQDIDPERGGLLVLDEPTAYLPASAVDKLYKILRDLAKRGIGVIFVSHRLDEVLSISDSISVLRDGQVVGTFDRDETTERDLIAAILGREIGVLYPLRRDPARQEALTVRDLVGDIVKGVSFEVLRGEVVGVTGIIGMGHDEVPYLLFGAKQAVSGTLRVGDREASLVHMTPSCARSLNMAFLPADRERQGGIPSATLLENITMPSVMQYFQHGHLRHKQEKSDADQALREFEVRPPDSDRILATLSGGNQQKVVLGKWLRLKPGILLLHEPTQGVDIGSRKQIFGFLRAIADSGTSVVIASSEYEDLANVCHRVLVFRNGVVVQELSGVNLTVERLVEQAYTTK